MSTEASSRSGGRRADVGANHDHASVKKPARCCCCSPCVAFLIFIVLAGGAAAAVVFGVLPNIPGLGGDENVSGGSSSPAPSSSPVPFVAVVRGGFSMNSTLSASGITSNGARVQALRDTIASAINLNIPSSRRSRSVRAKSKTDHVRSLQTATVTANDVTLDSVTGGGSSSPLAVDFSINVMTTTSSNPAIAGVATAVDKAMDGTGNGPSLGQQILSHPDIGNSFSGAVTVTRTAQLVASTSPSPTALAADASPSTTPSASPIPSSSASVTPSQSPSMTPSSTTSLSPTPTPSVTASVTSSNTPTPSVTPTSTASPSASPSSPTKHVTMVTSSSVVGWGIWNSWLVLSIPGRTGLARIGLNESGNDKLVNIDNWNNPAEDLPSQYVLFVSPVSTDLFVTIGPSNNFFGTYKLSQLAAGSAVNDFAFEAYPNIPRTAGNIAELTNRVAYVNTGRVYTVLKLPTATPQEIFNQFGVSGTPDYLVTKGSTLYFHGQQLTASNLKNTAYYYNASTTTATEVPDCASIHMDQAAGWGIVNGVFYFSSNGGAQAGVNGNGLGQELWKCTPGIGPAMIVDITTGATGSSPKHFATTASGKVVFSAESTGEGRSIWVHDPATGSTSIAATFSDGSSGANVQFILTSQNDVFWGDTSQKAVYRLRTPLA